MIKTWIADIRSLYDDDRYRQYYRKVPGFRQIKADKIRSQSGKAQSVGVWILWERMKEQFQITETAPHNFSHSGDYVLCSADIDSSQTWVGCDIEQIKPLNLRLAGRFYCPLEYQLILQQNTLAAQTELFYRFWVLKESFMKATGKGMAIDTRAFEFVLEDPPRLIKQPEAFPEKYYFKEYELPGLSYKIAVCSTDARSDPEIYPEQL